MKFRDVCKMNLVTMKLFRLQTLRYGTIQYTALEKDVCPSVWCGYIVPAAERLDLSAVGIAQLARAVSAMRGGNAVLPKCLLQTCCFY